MRVIAALAVHKDADGEIEVQHLSNLTKEQAIEVAEQGARGGRRAGRPRWAPRPRLTASSCSPTEQAWEVIAEIPNDFAAALILLEHHWAVSLCDAIADAGRLRISDGFVSPLDLVEVGLLTAEEAEQLRAIEAAATAK